MAGLGTQEELDEMSNEVLLNCIACGVELVHSDIHDDDSIIYMHYTCLDCGLSFTITVIKKDILKKGKWK